MLFQSLKSAQLAKPTQVRAKTDYFSVWAIRYSSSSLLHAQPGSLRATHSTKENPSNWGSKSVINLKNTVFTVLHPFPPAITCDLGLELVYADLWGFALKTKQGFLATYPLFLIILRMMGYRVLPFNLRRMILVLYITPFSCTVSRHSWFLEDTARPGCVQC